MSKNKFRIVANEHGRGWIQQMSVESEAIFRLVQDQVLRQELSADGELIFGFDHAWREFPKYAAAESGIRFSPFTGEPFEFSIAARDAKLIKQRLLEEQKQYEEEIDDGPGLREENVEVDDEEEVEVDDEEEEEEVEVDEEEVEVDDEDEYEYEEVEEDEYEYEEVEEDDDEYEEE